MLLLGGQYGSASTLTCDVEQLVIYNGHHTFGACMGLRNQQTMSIMRA
jgi:hypothetical protein